MFPLILARTIDWPKDMEIEPDCKSLIEELLVLEPSERLGARNSKQDMEALKSHPFFADVKFDDDLLTSTKIR